MRYGSNFDYFIRGSGMIMMLIFMVLASQKAESPQDKGDQLALKAAYGDAFKVGAALNSSHVTGGDSKAVDIITRHFNTITPENIFKFGPVHPAPDEYAFEEADQYVKFGEKQEMFIVGHNLVWHMQTPDWVFRTEEGGMPTRGQLLERMRDHIHTVVGRYKERIDGWDVVNEAITDNGRWRETRWKQIIGKDYVEKAFQFAREADPGAELYYNDYNLWKPSKRDAVIELVKELLDKDIKIDGIGMQAHLDLSYPPVDMIEESIEAFSDLGLKVMITELDIDVLPDPDDSEDRREDIDPYADRLPDSVRQTFTRRYAELFELFKKHQDKIDRVTFWGVHDGQSWLNYWPVKGRTNYPLLWDRDYKPKPALETIIKLTEN